MILSNLIWCFFLPLNRENNNNLEAMWTELEHLIKNYQQLNLQEVVDYEKFSMISVMWHSTKIGDRNVYPIL